MKDYPSPKVSFAFYGVRYRAGSANHLGAVGGRGFADATWRTVRRVLIERRRLRAKAAIGR